MGEWVNSETRCYRSRLMLMLMLYLPRLVPLLLGLDPRAETGRRPLGLGLS